jgi:hypothetical protein
MADPGCVDDDDYPRSMRDEGVRQRRRAMLNLPHVAKLTAYAAKLRLRGSVEVPEFDPLDGGVHARVLFLFEKPGPMTADGSSFHGRAGSGFISRNNDDPTAAATMEFMQKAGIPRKLTGSELRDGVECVKELVQMLPNLAAVVMVGQNAARARRDLESTELALFTSDHPSPLVKAKFRKRWNAIPSEWAKVMKVIAESPAV